MKKIIYDKLVIIELALSLFPLSYGLFIDTFLYNEFIYEIMITIMFFTYIFTDIYYIMEQYKKE